MGRVVPTHQPAKQMQRPVLPSHRPWVEHDGWPGHDNVGERVTAAARLACPSEEGWADGIRLGLLVGYVVKRGIGA